MVMGPGPDPKSKKHGNKNQVPTIFPHKVKYKHWELYISDKCIHVHVWFNTHVHVWFNTHVHVWFNTHVHVWFNTHAQAPGT